MIQFGAGQRITCPGSERAEGPSAGYSLAVARHRPSLTLSATLATLIAVSACAGGAAPPADTPEAGLDAGATPDVPNTTDDAAPDTGPAAELWQRPEPWLSACMTDPGCAVPLITAHRGEGSGAPENSLAAITQSAELGADMVEIDVRESADGVVVLMHDGTLGRTTNQKDVFPDTEEVSALTLSELKQLVLKDAEGVCTPETADDQPDRCRVPTLAAALDAARGSVLLMLDFKSADAVQVAELVAAHDALDTALFFDSNPDVLDAAEAAAPGLVTMPRAESVEETLQILADREPAVLHIDSHYVAEVAAAAAELGTRLFHNVLVEVDGYLLLYELTEDEVDLLEGRDVLHGFLDAGTGVVQTNHAPTLRPWVDEWCAGAAR